MKTMQNKLPERAFVSSIHQKLYYSQLNKLGNGIVAHNTFPLPDTRCWLVESFMYLMEKKIFTKHKSGFYTKNAVFK